ncbi:MAG: TetR/AcrR family transcriptional regulator [Candidatus Heimdallarchaeota archaeon]|nr:TetR/AcrR family transcriptional regulator [Candidatus Heimdallarchaeota archaeon]
MKKTAKNKSNAFQPEKITKVDRRIKKNLNAIYKSASQLFTEKPFADITMEEIAERANISRSTLYNHFKSKHEIYFQMGYDRFKSVNDDLIKLKTAPTTGFETIMTLCAELFKNINKNPMYTRIVSLFLVNKNLLTVDKILDNELPPQEAQNMFELPDIEIMAKYLEQLRRYEVLWAELIAKGISDGSIITNLTPIQLAHYLFLIINGTFDQMILKQYVLQKFELTNEMIFDKTMNIIKRILHE